MAIERICSICRHVYADESEFCSKDGGALLAMACPECFGEYGLADRHCTTDGAALVPTAATALRPITFEANVGVLGRTPLRITRQEITLGEASLRANDVTRLRWWVRREYLGPIRIARRHHIKIGSDVRVLDAECGRLAEKNADAEGRFNAIVDLLWQVVVPRVLRNMFRMLGAGTPVTVGGVTVLRDSVRFSHVAPWGTSSVVAVPIEEVGVVPWFNGLRISDKENTKRTFVQYSQTDNAVLLPGLILLLRSDAAPRTLNGEEQRTVAALTRYLGGSPFVPTPGEQARGN